MTMREKIARAMADLGDLDDWPNWLDLADAALSALEEPTEGMKGAGEMALIESGPSVNLVITAPLDAVLVWRAMIAAAKEG